MDGWMGRGGVITPIHYIRIIYIYIYIILVYNNEWGVITPPPLPPSHNNNSYYDLCQ